MSNCDVAIVSYSFLFEEGSLVIVASLHDHEVQGNMEVDHGIDKASRATFQQRHSVQYVLLAGEGTTSL